MVARAVPLGPKKSWPSFARSSPAAARRDIQSARASAYLALPVLVTANLPRSTGLRAHSIHLPTCAR